MAMATRFGVSLPTVRREVPHRDHLSRFIVRSGTFGHRCFPTPCAFQVLTRRTAAYTSAAHRRIEANRYPGCHKRSGQRWQDGSALENGSTLSLLSNFQMPPPFP